jgi:hypothetical protein
MSEHPLFAYWDQEAASGAPIPSSSQLQQQQQQQQQLLQAHFQHHSLSSSSQSAPQQQQQQQQPHLPLNLNYDFGNEQTGVQADLHSLMNVPSSGFNQLEPSTSSDNSNPTCTTTTTRSGGDTSALTNQQAVQQLQQNLMLMLQQQSDQSFNMNSGNQMSMGLQQSSLQQQAVRQQSTTNNHGVTSSSTQQDVRKIGGTNDYGRSSFLQDAFGTHDDSGNLLAQYRQLFGNTWEGEASSNIANRSSVETDATNTSPSSSRLFALGSMVEPLASNKPQLSTSSGDKKGPEISASSLGMSESSTDFMMKLFQFENNKKFTQSYDNSSRLQPMEVPTYQNITVGDIQQQF